MSSRLGKEGVIGSERGIVLTVVILLIALLLLIGVTAYMTTSTDLKITGNYKQIERAFFNAEAGIEEARTRLRGTNADANYAGDPASSVDPSWSAYILTSASWQTTDDPAYDSSLRNYIPTTASHTNTTVTVNPLQSPVKMTYAVKIRHKKEYDAEQKGHTAGSSLHYVDGDGDASTHTAASPGNVIYYGYEYTSPAATTPRQYTKAGSSAEPVVEVITARGMSGGAVKILEAEVTKLPPPPILAAIYAKGNVTGMSSSLNINGNDGGSCGGGNKPPVTTKSPAYSTLPNATLNGSPAAATTTTSDIEIAQYVTDMKAGATQTIPGGNITGAFYGVPSNYVTVYSKPATAPPINGELTLNGVLGYGALIVEGDLVLGGGFNWNGLIIVTGTLTFNGGGPAGINIAGAVLANQTVDLNGSVAVRYNSCNVRSAMGGQSLKILGWRVVY